MNIYLKSTVLHPCAIVLFVYNLPHCYSVFQCVYVVNNLKTLNTCVDLELVLEPGIALNVESGFKVCKIAFLGLKHH